MSTASSATPEQKFGEGITKALQYGKVHVDGVEIRDSTEAVNQVQMEGNGELLNELSVQLGLTFKTENEGVCSRITALLEKLKIAAEGTSPQHVSSVFVLPTRITFMCFCRR
jgi:hypothetical protein